MSLFVEKIKEYIKKSGYSCNQLAKKAGIDRSTLSKYLSEDRTFSKEAYEKLCKVLEPITPEKKTALDELFEKSKIGETRYEQRKKIKKMIEALGAEFLSHHRDCFIKKKELL